MTPSTPNDAPPPDGDGWLDAAMFALTLFAVGALGIVWKLAVG